MKKKLYLISLFSGWMIVFFVLFAFSETAETKNYSEEINVVPIPLNGPAAERQAEFSGLAWYDKYLVMLPQYPGRYGNHFFIIHQDSLKRFLRLGKTDAVTPISLQVNMPDFPSIIPGYEGFEAIGFYHNQVFITIESETASGVKGYLISGTVSPGLKDITLDDSTITEILPQTHLPNFSEEAMIVFGETVNTIYEINGSKLNNRPIMHSFSTDGKPLGNIPFPSIEYRITDATGLDSNNRFWVINYLWPGDGDKLDISEDPLFLKYGRGISHASSKAVERLIQLEYFPNGVILTGNPPLLLRLEKGKSRNWEGIVRFPDLGFLLVTDKYPETILGFVPFGKINER